MLLCNFYRYFTNILKMCINKFDAKKIIFDKFAGLLDLAIFKQLFICISLRDKEADRKSQKQDLSFKYET